MAITDDILDALGSGKIDTIAQQVGADPAQVRSIIEDAVPAMMGGLAGNARSDDGAASLASALGDHRDANPIDSLTDLLGGGGSGGGILGHVFGGNTDAVASAIGGKAGAQGVDVQKVLAVVASIVMSFLAKKMGEAPSSSAVQSEVAKENAAAQAKVPDLGDLLGGLQK